MYGNESYCQSSRKLKNIIKEVYDWEGSEGWFKFWIYEWKDEWMCSITYPYSIYSK